MEIQSATFINEYGNLIRMHVELGKAADGTYQVGVLAEGPHSKTEHKWTLKEAMKLQQLLTTLDLPKVR